MSRKIALRNRHWRVIRQDHFSFHMDRYPYIAQYRSRFFGIWRGAPNPYWIGPMCFLSNDEAVEWINEREPRSIIECALPVVLKPKNWNDWQYASGQYGARKQMTAIARLELNRQP